MKFQYLGTAAAEGIPGMFCNCPVCQRTREAGGKNYRSRAQAIINEDLMLDFGPDTYWHTCRFGLDLSKVQFLLITHAHDDHLTPKELHYRENGFAYLFGDKNNDDSAYGKLNVFLSEQSRSFLPPDIQNSNTLDLHTIRAFEPFSIGCYTITALTAHHAPGYGALMYLIDDGKKIVLYAHDTGFFPSDTMEYLKNTRPQPDFISLDCTGVLSTCGPHHMNLADATQMKQQLIDIGCAKENTLWYVNHFSHNGFCTHDELVPLAKKEGFSVSYDGLTLDI